VAIAFALAASTAAANGFSMVPVGNPGAGGVGYFFEISSLETTNAQYADFLNSVDPTGANSKSIYDPRMQSDVNGGINKVVNGTPYVVKTGFESKPVNLVTWSSAARFVNWLSNGATSSSDTEIGTYDVADPSAGRLRGGYVLPSASEWYKAAFYNSGSDDFYLWPTSSDTKPTATVADFSGSNSANYGGNGTSTGPTNVGAYTNTFSPYSAFDMMGNVTEMTDTVSGGSSRIFGGSWALSVELADGFSSIAPPQTRGLTSATASLGFRVVIAPVPEPGTISLAVVGGLAMVASGWIKRRRAGAVGGGARTGA
jgi:formylglycine-generating enzyme required for sulfatase activity